MILTKISFAQTIDVYFPRGVSGYDEQLGVTVLTRARPLYQPLGVQVGDFVIQPEFDEGLFANSNVNAAPNSNSWGSHTAGAISAVSGWSRDSLSVGTGFERYQYFSLPNESYTNWNIGVAGGYTIADSQLILAYSHQSYYQLGTNIGAVRSEMPVLDQADSARMEYKFNFGRLSVTPDLSVGAYRYDSATAQGITFDQHYLDHNVVAGGITTRYATSENAGLLVVGRGMDAVYMSNLSGRPRNDSASALLLLGLDYQAEGLWRYRLLGGMEVRHFVASQYGTHVAPDIEASVIWTPTNLATITGTVGSAIEAPQTAGTAGYTLNQARLVVDYEYRANVFFQGRGGIQRSQNLQGGQTQTNLTAGAGVTWLINRRMRLSVDYDYTSLSGLSVSSAQSPNAQTSQPFKQSLLALALHLAL